MSFRDIPGSDRTVTLTATTRAADITTATVTSADGGTTAADPRQDDTDHGGTEDTGIEDIETETGTITADTGHIALPLQPWWVPILFHLQ